MAVDKQVLVVSLVGGFLGLLSVILGFIAEVTKIKASDVLVTEVNCSYPSSPAAAVALGAILLLVLAQIIVTAFAGCCGCCKKDPSVPVVTGTKQSVSLIFTIISWITFAIAVILFILGAGRNAQAGQTVSRLDNCYVVKTGILAGGAICALFTMSLSITAYILLTPRAGSKTSEITLGTPQYPQAQPQYSPAQPQYPQAQPQYYSGPGVGGSQYLAPGIGGAQYPPQGTNYA